LATTACDLSKPVFSGDTITVDYVISDLDQQRRRTLSILKSKIGATNWSLSPRM